ncbi:MAG: cupin domain-containing protein [Candidatus Eremiobacteraeota bacterium]|nr:cupin domain-containing protein [Candidatus Eremiobacteraeota bacterium]
MKSRFCVGRAAATLAVAALWLAASASPLPSSAQETVVIKSLAEKKIAQLPAGLLYWTIENFPTLAAAQGAEGPSSLAVEADGRAWLFSLGVQGLSTPGGTKVAQIGPLPAFSAPSYLLRINSAVGPAGAKTPIHTHPGIETFYVVAGQLSQQTPSGISQVSAGQSMVGHAPDTPMQVSSTGADSLDALVMFVVDATRPFSSPAQLP